MTSKYWSFALTAGSLSTAAEWSPLTLSTLLDDNTALDTSTGAEVDAPTDEFGNPHTVTMGVEVVYDTAQIADEMRAVVTMPVYSGTPPAYTLAGDVGQNAGIRYWDGAAWVTLAQTPTYQTLTPPTGFYAKEVLTTFPATTATKFRFVIVYQNQYGAFTVKNYLTDFRLYYQGVEVTDGGGGGGMDSNGSCPWDRPPTLACGWAGSGTGGGGWGQGGTNSSSWGRR